MLLSNRLGLIQSLATSVRQQPNEHSIDKVSTEALHAVLKRASIENFRRHDLCHAWVNWQNTAGSLMEFGG